MSLPTAQLTAEIKRRRTFAIISHPDAGKTTLTEKLLWFGGAIQVAGEVRGRKASRHATSDWMELEKQRGISVTSSVMQFPYREHMINLLDTPGHDDFSEDTYRTLTAVDSAVMVIDSVNGVEAQTIKLLNVCRMRDTPIVTFINKLDRESRPPIDLMDEIETTLGMECAPMTWPIGMGKGFRGVYNLYTDSISFFDPRAEKGTSEIIQGLENPRLDVVLGKMAEELRIDCFANTPKLAVQLHLPVQAGSDRILMAMKRNYTGLHFKSTIRKLRLANPNLSFTSDFIVGFPGETEAEFEATLRLVQEVNFDYSFSFLYSPRPGTPASYLSDDTPQAIKLARLTRLQSLIEAQGDAISRAMLGSTQRVLIDGASWKDASLLAGKTDNNRLVDIDCDVEKLAAYIHETVNVKITDVTNPKRLRGEIID